MEENTIFRQKSLDKLKTPEELRDYVKVTGVSTWLFLSAVIILLIGVCVWGYFGRLQTEVTTGSEVKKGKIMCYLTEKDSKKITEETVIEIDGQEISVDTQNIVPVEITDDFNTYLCHLCGVKNGDFVYMVEGSCQLEDGVYETDVVLDSVSPMTFVFN